MIKNYRQQPPNILPIGGVQHSTIKEFFDAENFHPYHDLVLVERLVEDAPLVHVPDAVKEREQKCRVIEVGPGRLTEYGTYCYAPCQVGDMVFVQPNKCFNIEIKGRKLALYNAQDILGVFSATKPEKVKGARQAAETITA